MKTSEPSLEQKARLYQAAMQVKEIAPWEWMTEAAVFGVENPETGRCGFVSVMGQLGEHYAVAVYLGVKGLDGFWGMHSGELDPDGILEIPHLQASFEDRALLTKKDRDEIKELGLKFRGRQAWPMFRCYRPGYFPWYLEAQEATFLTWALEQLVEIAPRIHQNPDLLITEDGETYLVRVAEEEKEGLAWVDRVMKVPEVEPEVIPILMDMEKLEWLKSLPRSEPNMEMDFFLFPARIGERGERPRCAYMLLIVEDGQGMVLGSQLLEPEPTFEAMYGKVPLTIVNLLANVGFVPKEVRVKSELLQHLLEPLVVELGFEVKWTPALWHLESAKEFLQQRFI